MVEVTPKEKEWEGQSFAVGPWTRISLRSASKLLLFLISMAAALPYNGFPAPPSCGQI